MKRKYLALTNLSSLFPLEVISFPMQPVTINLSRITIPLQYYCVTLRWRHNERDCVSNHQPHDCLLKRLFRRRSKKTSKLRVTGLCAGNSSVTGEFPAQRASNAETVSIWWRHHEFMGFMGGLIPKHPQKYNFLIALAKGRHAGCRHFQCSEKWDDASDFLIYVQTNPNT